MRGVKLSGGQTQVEYADASSFQGGLPERCAAVAQAETINRLTGHLSIPRPTGSAIDAPWGTPAPSRYSKTVPSAIALPQTLGPFLTTIAALVLAPLFPIIPGAAASTDRPPETVGEPPITNLCDKTPAEYLESILNQPHLRRSHWGILIQPLSSPANPPQSPSIPWLAHNANQFFNPASNGKLLTTAAVLTHLGSNPTTLTSLTVESSSQAAPPNLWLYPLGDPTLDSDVIGQFADTTHNAGITAIDTLWVHATDFGLARRGRIASWEWGDLPFYYGSPVSTAILNQNRMVLNIMGTQTGQLAQVSFSDAIAADQWQIDNQVTTSAPNLPAQIAITPGWPNTLHLTGTVPPGATNPVRMAIPQPAVYLGNTLKLALEQRGITVNQVRISRDAPPQPGQAPLALHFSPPISELVHTTNQASNNLYAETLLGWLSLNLKPNPSGKRSDIPSEIADGSTPAERSRSVLNNTLATLGLSSDQYRIVDGSGLSRQNLVTPQALVTLLTQMWRSPESATFRRSLPIAGETGTLRNRFKGTILEDNLIAKTGTLTGVSTLSGYFLHGETNWVAFSILVNHSNQPASVLRQTMDELLVAIAETPSECLSAR